jgi:RNA polymerase subunit RPABC4/transcription elongation factor Spt4
MAFECVHCGTMIEDDALKVPRSGATCPACKKDPTEGWSPYLPEVAEQGRKVADEMNLRIMLHDYGVQEATLFFLEDLMLEKRHELSIRLGRRPGIEQRCSVCNAVVPGDEGFRIELYDRWRATSITIGLCERHLNEGLWGRELDLHANHPNPWLTRGDWHYPTSGRERHA